MFQENQLVQLDQSLRPKEIYGEQQNDGGDPENRVLRNNQGMSKDYVIKFQKLDKPQSSAQTSIQENTTNNGHTKAHQDQED